MKKLIGTILLLSLIYWSASAQKFGENGTNVPVNLTPEVRATICEKTPQGETYVLCFRNDKYAEDGIDLAPQSEINNVIALRNELEAQGSYFELIYTFDTRGRCAPEDAFFAFDQFTGVGINIPAVRYGNEEFAKLAGHWISGSPNFDHYYSFIQPLELELQERNYTGYQAFTLDKTDGAFNSDISEYAAGSPFRIGDIHFYWNKTNCSALDTASGYLIYNAKGELALPNALMTDNGYAVIHDEFFDSLYHQIVRSNLIDETMSVYEENFPGKPVIITEVGPAIGIGTFGNTLGYEATVDWFFNQTKKYNVLAVCKFNGAGSITGSVTKRSGNDSPLVTGEYLRRLDHYTYAQFLRNKNAIDFPVTSLGVGTYTISLHNMNRGEMELMNLANEDCYVSSFEYEYISGENYYSSSGAQSWWSNGSDKTYEITGSQFNNVIPPLSYGYLHVTICKDVTVFDTTYVTTQEPNICPKRCSGFIYKIFHGAACSVCGGTHPVTTEIITPRTVTICQ